MDQRDRGSSAAHGTAGLPLAGAATLTFLAAASVLVLEIAAGRLLAPYVGVSLTTYTGIIGAILAGIALGAWLGGRAADVVGPLPLIGPAFVVGGASAIAAVPIVSIIGEAGLGGGFVPIVAMATAGFVVPAAVLSSVGPMLVRATIRDVASSGSVVGQLSAIGTVGAIAGTFLTGFVLLGLVPTRVLIVAVGIGLAVIGLVVSVRLWQARPASTLVLAGIVGASSVLASAYPSPCSTESAYYCVEIRLPEGRPDMRVLVLDGLTHAAVDLSDATHLEYGYLRRFADATEAYRAALGRAPDVLHVGGGGFTFPRFLEARHPGAQQVVLELDPRVYQIAQDELGFVPTATIDVQLGDARQSIEALPSDAFDLAFGDAFGGLAVPWHLTTTAFLDEVVRVLRPGGMYVANVIDYPPLAFARAEAATAATRFGHVGVISGRPTIEGRSGGNLVLVASDTPIDRASTEAAIATWREVAETGIVTGSAELAAFVGQSVILTDDYAPVDQLLGR